MANKGLSGSPAHGLVQTGGVGSWAAEAYNARSGVGEFPCLIWMTCCVSNSNRRLHALDSTVGQPKVGDGSAHSWDQPGLRGARWRFVTAQTMADTSPATRCD